MEVWKTLIYNGNEYKDFEVSDSGRLRRISTDHEYGLSKSKTGYLFVTTSLGSRGNKKQFKAHRCVVETFIPRDAERTMINHKDGIKTNNHLSNLEWCNRLENARHASIHGLLKKGDTSPVRKLDAEKVKVILNKAFSEDSPKGWQKKLAQEYGVSKSTIFAVVHRRAWAHVNI